MQRLLLIIGILFILGAVLWPVIQKVGLGRLPGDIVIERDNFRLYIPIATMLLLSILLSLVLWIIRKIF